MRKFYLFATIALFLLASWQNLHAQSGIPGEPESAYAVFRDSKYFSNHIEQALGGGPPLNGTGPIASGRDGMSFRQPVPIRYYDEVKGEYVDTLWVELLW